MIWNHAVAAAVVTDEEVADADEEVANADEEVADADEALDSLGRNRGQGTRCKVNCKLTLHYTVVESMEVIFIMACNSRSR